jgi:hypothetical protein
VRFGPIGSFNYQGLWMNGYTEHGSSSARLKFDDLAVHQIGLRAGADATYSFVVPWGLIAPEVRMVGVYEELVDRGPLVFAKVDCAGADCEKQRASVAQPDRFFMELGLGLSATFPEGWIASVNYQDNFFRDRNHASYVALSLRRQF